MEEKPFPARLHILLARESNTALVIRRGPADYTCVLGWDRKNNTFEVGQWLKGRLYERRCDLSPSGKHWIYFAMNGHWGSEAKGAWTAIARAPWLKAIALYPKGDCWNGGGLFLDNKRFWLNGGIAHEPLTLSSEVEQDATCRPEARYGGECPSVYYHRLQRDGWTLVGKTERGKWDAETVFEKALPRKWVLRKRCHEQVGPPKGKACYWDEHELLSAGGESLARPDWEWAEWVDNAIVYAEHGCLYRLIIKSPTALGESALLHDFNQYRFENREAPY